MEVILPKKTPCVDSKFIADYNYFSALIKEWPVDVRVSSHLKNEFYTLFFTIFPFFAAIFFGVQLPPLSRVFFTGSCRFTRLPEYLQPSFLFCFGVYGAFRYHYSFRTERSCMRQSLNEYRKPRQLH